MIGTSRSPEARPFGRDVEVRLVKQISSLGAPIWPGGRAGAVIFETPRFVGLIVVLYRRPSLSVPRYTVGRTVISGLPDVPQQPRREKCAVDDVDYHSVVRDALMALIGPASMLQVDGD